MKMEEQTTVEVTTAEVTTFINQTLIYTPTDTSSAIFIIYTTIRFIQGAIIALGNTLTIAAVIKNPSLQTNGHILVAHLAVADLFSAIAPATELFTTLSENDYDLWSIACDIRPLFSGLTTQMNCLFVAIISIDRLVYVKFPLRYIMLVTKVRLSIGVGCVYVLSLMSSVMSIFSKYSPFVTFCELPYIDTSSRLVGIFFAGAAAIIIASNVSIAIIAKRQQQEINRLSHKVSSNDLKLIKMLMMVLGIFLIAYLPWILALGLQEYLKYGPNEYRQYNYIISPVLWINGCANPIIYAWNDRQFRRAFLKLLGCQRALRKIRQEESSGTNIITVASAIDTSDNLTPVD